MLQSNSICCDEESSTDVSTTLKAQQVPLLLKSVPTWSGIAVKDAQMYQLSLTDFKDKYLVFLFYPCDFTFVCPTELIQFSDRVEEFRSIGAEIVAVSTDSKFAHFVWTTTPRKQGGIGEVNIPLLADKNHKISKDYGVLDENSGTSLRALFVIDDKQILRHITINDPAIPRSVDEVLRVIKNSQFVDKYGDVCPIGPKQKARSSDTNNREDFFQVFHSLDANQLKF